MHAFMNILVPVDFGETSARAIALARSLAAPDTKITLVHVFEPLAFLGYGSSLYTPVEELRERTQRRLDSELAKLEEEHANAAAVLSSGTPSERICAAAREAGADLIVMGTQGLTGASRLFLGSVAEKVVRNSSVPVMTIGPERKHGNRTAPAVPKETPC